MAAAVCASSSVAAVAAAPSSRSAQKAVQNVGAVKASFLSGRALRQGKLSASAVASQGPVGVRAAAVDRPVWLPGSTVPSYLDGSLPGDNGFDPLGLGEESANLKWYVQAELQNGRWAMLGVAGMLIPELLTKVGILSVPTWYDAGAVEYFAPPSTLFVIEFILFHYVEVRRWQDIKYPGSVSQDPFFPNNKLPPGEVGYPGGIFNPLKFPISREYKEKEIANGRLAMLAFLGFVVQHKLTGLSPVDNLFAHIADPWHNTIIQTLQGL